MSDDSDIDNSKPRPFIPHGGIETELESATTIVKNVPATDTASVSRVYDPSYTRSDIQYNGDGSLESGTVVRGRFVIEALLGSGGMGSVYRALDLRKHEAGDQEPYIAIKILSGDFQRHTNAFVTLQREAKKTQVLAHPNVVTVYDFDRDDALIYLTMEELVGFPLSEYLKNNTPRPLTLAQRYRVIDQIAKGLSYAHSKGIIHSDLKPANIFVSDNASVKILDFGIARAMTEGNYQDTFDAGSLGALTLAYASLEMIETQAPHPADDIYALGIIAYELLDGHHPYARYDASKAFQSQIKPKKPQIKNSFLRGVLLRSVALERKDRIKNASAFLRAFHRRKNAPKQLFFSVLALCLALGANALYIQSIDTQIVPFNALTQMQQRDFHTLIASGNRALAFKDIEGAVTYFNDAYAIHKTHKDIKKAKKTILSVFEKNIRLAKTPDEKQFALEQQKSLQEYPAFKPTLTD